MHFLLRRLRNLFRHSDLNVLVRSLSLSLFVLLSGGLAIWLLEGRGKGTMFKSYGDTVWWGITTMTTVGYGDKYPETAAGRVVGVILMFFGIAILGTCLGIVASFLVERKRKEELGLKDFSQVEGHTLICNFDRHDKDLIDTIRHDRPKDTLIVLTPHLKEKPDFFDEWTHFVSGKGVINGDLQRAGAAGARTAIILVNRDDGDKDGDTVLAVLGIRALNERCYICAELEHTENSLHLKRAGADTIISWGSLRNKLFAQEAMDRGVTAVITDLVDASGEQIEKMVLDAETVRSHSTFESLMRHLKESRNVLAFALEREGKHILNPDRGYILKENDYLFCIGS